MRTVIKAVIELKAEWTYTSSEAAYYRSRHVEGYWYYGEDKPFNDEYVCTREEFEELVNDMSNNFGRSMTYTHYKLSLQGPGKFELIEEVKPVILDDNSMQAKISNIGNVLHNLSCSADDNEQDELGAHASFLWDLSKGYSAVTVGKVENSKPEYTQAMFDAGELPSVGMECLIKIDYQEDTLFKKGYINGYSQDKKWLIFTDDLDDLGRHCIDNGVYKFKPLEPSVVLEDGSPYKFNYKDAKTEILGFYIGHKNAFFTSKCCSCEICKIHEATNIQLLTPEVK